MAGIAGGTGARITSITWTVPWSSPTASSCFVADEWNSIDVTAADVIATLIDGAA